MSADISQSPVPTLSEDAWTLLHDLRLRGFRPAKGGPIEDELTAAGLVMLRGPNLALAPAGRAARCPRQDQRGPRLAGLAPLRLVPHGLDAAPRGPAVGRRRQPGRRSATGMSRAAGRAGAVGPPRARNLDGRFSPMVE